MAQLTNRTTLDLLIATISDLEARVTDLKRAANTLADQQSQELPYAAVGTALRPFRFEATSDAGVESESDSQD